MYTDAIRKQLTWTRKGNFGKYGHNKQGPPTHGNLLVFFPNLASATQSTGNAKTNLCYN